MKFNYQKPFYFLLLLSCCLSATWAQSPFTLTGQLRTRTEFRDGQGTLPLRGVTPSVFTSQRTRLSAGFTSDRFRVLTTIQDVRVWGMDGSTISNMEGNRLFIHEAWGDVIVNDSTWNNHKLSLRIGRQELVYDDARLLGNLDWLQQGRRHDAAVLKYLNGTFQMDAGVAFNQDREKKNAGNLYVGVPLVQGGSDTSLNVAAPANSNFQGRNYKSMQYLYIAKELGLSKLSFLFFKDDFQKTRSAVPAFTNANPAAGANSIGRVTKGVYSRLTTGINIFATIMRKHKLDISAFYQGNQDPFGHKLSAYFFMVNPQIAIGRKLVVAPGVDYLSGNNTNSTSLESNRFDPLYGTPHKFWGLMDYFYVADPYGVGGNNYNAPGLLNYYLKFRYKLRDNINLFLDVHEFYGANDVADATTPVATDVLDRRLGTEFDLVLQYALTKQIGFEAGYGLMLGTNTLDRLKAPATVDKRNNGNWAYLMINIRPDFLFAKPAPPPALPDAIKTK